MNQTVVRLTITVCFFWALIGPGADCGETHAAALSFRLAYDTDRPDTTKMQMKLSDEIFYVSNQAILDQRDVSRSRVEHGIVRPLLIFTLKPDGSKRLSDTSAAHLGSHLALIIDDVLVSAPMIRQRLDGNEFTINTDRLSEIELNALATRINALVEQ